MIQIISACIFDMLQTGLEEKKNNNKKNSLSQHYENPFARGLLRDLNQQ